MLKLLQENTAIALQGIDVGKDFLARTLCTQKVRSTIDKWDLMNLKSFYIAKAGEEETHSVGGSFPVIHLKRH